jgi:hypothetical protein
MGIILQVEEELPADAGALTLVTTVGTALSARCPRAQRPTSWGLLAWKAVPERGRECPEPFARRQEDNHRFGRMK